MSDYESKSSGLLASKDNGPDMIMDIILRTPEHNMKRQCQNPSSGSSKQNCNLLSFNIDPSGEDKNCSKSIPQKFFQVILSESSEGEVTVDKCVRDCKSLFQLIWQIELYRLSLTIKTKEYLLANVINVIVKRLLSKDYRKLSKANIAIQNDHIAYKISNTLNVYAYGKFPAPFCYFANDEMIIVSNLHKEGYKGCDNNENYITLEQCRHILQALARFHAATLVLKYLEPEILDNIKNLTKHELCYGEASTVLIQQQATLQNIISIHMTREPTEENTNKIKALEYLLKYTQNNIKKLLSDPEDNHVFCHGNLLPRNCLFKQEENEEVVVKFVNFQKFNFFSLASDLVYLFFVNLQSDEYIENKKDLLKCYYGYLTEYIEERDVPVDAKLTRKWLLKEINRFTEYGIIYALWSLPIIYNNKKEATNGFYNKRMEKWVEYYSKIYKRRTRSNSI